MVPQIASLVSFNGHLPPGTIAIVGHQAAPGAGPLQLSDVYSAIANAE